MSHKNIRLDVAVCAQRPDLSRSLVQSWIKQGLVSVNGHVATKVSMLVGIDDTIELQLDQPEFVSRSGAKLKQALQQFHIDVTGLTALDVGLSTGGFTDCLLQHGIAQVTGVDVGTAQVHAKVSQDPRVKVLEQTDIRDCLGRISPVDFVCVDVSFISVTKIIDVVVRLVKPGGKVVILIKPQFETEKKMLARGGILKNDALRDQVMRHVIAAIEQVGLELQECVESKLVGGQWRQPDEAEAKTGNIEYLAYFIKKI